MVAELTSCSRGLNDDGRREAAFDVEVFYDGDCPLCWREISMLKRRDKGGRIRFTNIAADDFDCEGLGIPHAELMSEIHGRLRDGRWIKGVEVFRRLYAAIGFHWLVKISTLPGIASALELGYHLVAKNRLKLTGRCSTDGSSCQLDPPH